MKMDYRVATIISVLLLACLMPPPSEAIHIPKREDLSNSMENVYKETARIVKTSFHVEADDPCADLKVWAPSVLARYVFYHGKQIRCKSVLLGMLGLLIQLVCTRPSPCAVQRSM